MKRGLLALLVSAVVVGTGVAVLWAYSALQDEGDRFSSARFVPGDASLFIAINTDWSSGQWLAFRRLLKSAATEKRLGDAWNDALAEEDVDWRTEIAPLIGENAALAILDFEALEDGGGLIFVLALRDQKRAETTLLRLIRDEASEQRNTVLESSHEDVKITYVQSSRQRGRTTITEEEGAIAFFDGHAIAGSKVADVRLALDAVKGRTANVRDTPRFQERRKEQQGDFLLWGYAGLSAFWDRIEEQASTPETETLLRNARDGADTFTFALKSERYGLVLDMAVLRGPGAPPLSALSRPFDPLLANHMADDTMFFLGAQGGSWSDQLRKSRSENRELDQSLRELEREVGIQIESELLNHLTGEFALALNVEGAREQFSVLALAGLGDATVVARTLDRVAAYLRLEEALPVITGPDANGLRRIGPDRLGQDNAAWTIVGKTLVAGYPESSVVNYGRISPRTLAGNADWKRLDELLPEERSYVAYLSISRILKEVDAAIDLDTQIRRQSDGELTLADFEAFRALGVAGYQDRSGAKTRLVLLMESD